MTTTTTRQTTICIWNCGSERYYWATLKPQRPFDPNRPHGRFCTYGDAVADIVKHFGDDWKPKLAHVPERMRAEWQKVARR